MEIELYCLVDSVGKLYYTGFQEKQLNDFKKQYDYLNHTFIIKLTGILPEGEK